MDLSIVVPAYNESSKIEADLTALVAYSETRVETTEIIVVDDGSSDGTRHIALDYANGHSNDRLSIRVLHYAANRGKGYAVRFGVKRSTGRRVAFVDSGMCVPLKYLDAGLNRIDEGFDFAIASRRLAASKIRRYQPGYRKLGSIVFWKLMKAFMDIEVTDTQCGFKVYRGESARRIFGELRIDGFMFDIEALRVAKRMGFRGTEFPVEWSNDGDTRYHPIFGTIRNLSELLRIRLHDLDRGRHA